MRLVADEGVDRQIVERLRIDRHDVVYIAELEPGQTDDNVLRLSVDLGAILLTQDKDFGELVVRSGASAKGVLLLRLAGMQQHDKCDLVSTTLQVYGDQMAGAFCVLTPRNLRVRKFLGG